jgi:sirohydrochlorin ferrochelatase
MSHTVLLAVAHGSRHPHAAAAVAALARQVERLAPVINIRVAFVEHSEPSFAKALAEAGPDVVIVPLLLSSGYHLDIDIGAAATPTAGASSGGAGNGRAGQAHASGVPAGRIAGPLGPDPLLTRALASRLVEAGVPPGTPVVLAAAGSADARAAKEVQEQADLLAEELGVPVVTAYAAAGEPSVPQAVAELRAATQGQVAVASYLLAPGHFHDTLARSGADFVTAPLGDHPAVAALIIDRYRTHRTAA